MKTYLVTDLDQLDSIRAWVMDPANCSTLAESQFGDSVEYSVLVAERWGPGTEDHYEQEFLARFAAGVQSIE